MLQLLASGCVGGWTLSDRLGVQDPKCKDTSDISYYFPCSQSEGGSP